MDPISDPKTTDTKPGFKTTEFWLSTAAMIVGLVLASGIFSPDDPSSAKILQALGLVSSILASLGYTAGRAHTKATAIKSAAMASVAEGLKKADPS